MPRLLFCLSLVLAPLLSIAADTDLTAIKEKLSKRLPNNISTEGLRPSKAMPGWYELERGMQLLYISGDGKHLFLGDLIDLEAQNNLTEDWRQGLARQKIDAIGEANMIVIGPKDPKRTITVFTDVDCPYCAKLHRDVPDLNKNGVKVRYLLFPRTGLQSETYRRSVAVWCAADRVNAVGVAKAGGKLDMKTCANPVEQHYRLGLQLNVSGTPTIFLDDGQVVGGYVPTERMLAILNLTPPLKTSNAR